MRHNLIYCFMTTGVLLPQVCLTSGAETVTVLPSAIELLVTVSNNYCRSFPAFQNGIASL